MERHKQAFVNEYAQLIVASMVNREPVQVIAKGVCDVVALPSFYNQTSRCVDKRLEWTQKYSTRRTKYAVAIVHAGYY